MQSVLTRLKAKYKKIHFFGLGFIQVKTDNPWERWHFYVPELPAFVEYPHNHRYSFSSVVFKGSIYQTIYAVQTSWNDSHELIEVTCREGTESKIVDYVGIKETLSFRTSTHYQIDSNVFHTVAADPYTVTVLNTTKPVRENAQVIRPVGTKEVCPFSQKYEDEYLWELVDKCLKM